MSKYPFPRTITFYEEKKSPKVAANMKPEFTLRLFHIILSFLS